MKTDINYWLNKPNPFIFEATRKNDLHYYYVRFPNSIISNTKYFNKTIHTIDDAIKYRNMILSNYIKYNNRYSNEFQNIINS